MRDVFDAIVDHLSRIGATHHLQPHARIQPATDAELAALAALAGPLPAALVAWWQTADRALPFYGAMTGLSAKNALRGATSSGKMVREGVFTRHLEKIRGWKDGRWKDKRMAEVYWSEGWLPIAADGCGNEICVDLAPGRKGQRGQLIAMEWQDGQGPYLSPWPDLAGLLKGHLRLLERGEVTADEEGFAVFPDHLSPGQVAALLAD